MWMGSASNMSTPSHIQRELLHFRKTKVSRRQFVSRALWGNISNSLCKNKFSMGANVASEHRTQLRRAWCQRTYVRALVVKSIELKVGDLNTIMTKAEVRTKDSRLKARATTKDWNDQRLIVSDCILCFVLSLGHNLWNIALLCATMLINVLVIGRW